MIKRDLQINLIENIYQVRRKIKPSDNNGIIFSIIGSDLHIGSRSDNRHTSRRRIP